MSQPIIFEPRVNLHTLDIGTRFAFNVEGPVCRRVEGPDDRTWVVILDESGNPTGMPTVVDYAGADVFQVGDWSGDHHRARMVTFGSLKRGDTFRRVGSFSTFVKVDSGSYGYAAPGGWSIGPLYRGYEDDIFAVDETAPARPEGGAL